MSDLRIIDAHMHLWDIEENYYGWLIDRVKPMWIGDYSKIRRNYLVADYLHDVASINVTKSVHLQAMFDMRDPPGESRWLQQQADRYGFPHAIVGFADFRQPDAEAILERHAAFPNMRGIRMDLNWHPDALYSFADAPDIMEDPVWLSRFGLLQRYDWSFDLQIYAGNQGTAAARFVDRFPNILFILDHSGAPADPSEEGLEAWRQGLRMLAKRDNVVTKLSGFDMFDHHWTVGSLQPRVLDVVEIFGVSRCIFASNFPVSSLYGSYEKLVSSYCDVLHDFSPDERDAIFFSNAARCYRLND